MAKPITYTAKSVDDALQIRFLLDDAVAGTLNERARMEVTIEASADVAGEPDRLVTLRYEPGDTGGVSPVFTSTEWTQLKQLLGKARTRAIADWEA